MRDFPRVLFFVLAFTYPAFATAQTAWSAPALSGNMQAEAGQLFALANQARAAAGAPQLKWDSALAAAALAHCRRMAAEGPIAHRYMNEPSLAGRASQTGAHFGLIEENVAIGPTPEAIQDAWIHSPGHRTNMLSPDVDHVGVAIVRARGTLYAVADFAEAVPILTPSQVEAAVAGLIRVSGVTILRDPTAARQSCVLSKGFAGTNQPGFIMRWQSSDLTRLPRPLVDRLATGQYRQAAVGSCPAQGSEDPFTTYRVAVLLY